MYIRDTIELYLGAYYPITLIALENYSYASNFKAHQLGELGGLIREFIYNYKYPLLLVSPQQNKKYFTGSGNATKEKMITQAQELGFPMPAKGKKDDLADAFSLSLLGNNYYKMCQGITPRIEPHQKQIIKDLQESKGTYEDLVKFPNGIEKKKKRRSKLK